jgi:23S rRNA pseudouridine2457 synthase
VNKLGLKKVDKEYYVQVDGMITQEAIDQMKDGVEMGFDGGKYQTKMRSPLD